MQLIQKRVNPIKDIPMKAKLKNIRLLILAAAMVFILAACGSEDVTLNIVDTAEEDGRFTTLIAALQAAELDDDLKGDGPFTVFAPTDDAFDKLPPDTVDFLLTPAGKSTLTDILTFHVFGGDLRKSDVASLNGTAANMLNTKDLRIDVVDGKVILSLGGGSQAEVIITDILATNGVIHAIDVVLNPGDATLDIVDTAIAAGVFTELLGAASSVGLVGALRGDGPLTVFAPTDAAFKDLLVPPADLEDTLLYHVFDGTVLEDDAIALNGQNVTMLNGDPLAITVTGSGVVLNNGRPQAATVILTNILCSNGTIHVINAVLDPADAP
jgi:transforming growth factor-beta-induced protein